jgi:hypothetical protein
LRVGKDLFDVGEKCRAIDRAVKHGGRREPLEAQPGDHGVSLPVTAWGVIPEACATRTAAIPAEQIRRHAAFVQKDVLPDIAHRLRRLPLVAGRRNVRPALLVGVYGFF